MPAIVALELINKPAELSGVKVRGQKIPPVCFGETRKLQRLKLPTEIQFLQRLWGVN